MNTQPSLNIQLWYFVLWYFDILYYNILYFLFLYFCVWASHPAKPGYPALIWTKQCPPGSYSTPASVSFLLMFFFIVLDSLHFFLFLGLSRNAWVRSLHCLVLSSKLTHWFMLLRLDCCGCDPGWWGWLMSDGCSEAEVWSLRFWKEVWLRILSWILAKILMLEVQLRFRGWILVKILRLKFGQNSETVFWSRLV